MLCDSLYIYMPILYYIILDIVFDMCPSVEYGVMEL